MVKTRILSSFARLMLKLSVLMLALLSFPSRAADISTDTLEDGTALITITGTISPGDNRSFLNAALRFEKAIVILDSPGGSLQPALEIGRAINLKGYLTFVPDNAICASSCALIWLAGEIRFLSPRAQLGFHASYRDESGRLVESGVGNALIGHYLSQLNLPARAVIFATQAPPDSILWLTSENMRDSGIPFELFELDGGKKSETTVGSVDRSLPAPNRSNGPAFWKISDTDTTIYLLPSIGAIPPDLGWFTGPIESAFFSAEELILEQGTWPESLTERVQRLMKLPRRQRLFELMGASDRSALDRAFAKLNWSTEGLDELKPWAATLMIVEGENQLQGFDEGSYLSSFLISRSRSKKVDYIREPNADYYEKLDSFSHDIQFALLREHIDQMPYRHQMNERGVSAWLTGDIEGFASLMRNSDITYRLYWDYMTEDDKMHATQWLATRMDSPGTVFVALSALSFASPNGVPQNLKALGFNVDKLQ